MGHFLLSHPAWKASHVAVPWFSLPLTILTAQVSVYSSSVFGFLLIRDGYLWFILSLLLGWVMQNVHSITPRPDLRLCTLSFCFQWQTRIPTERLSEAWKLPPFLLLQTQGPNSLPAALTCSHRSSFPVPTLPTGLCRVLLSPLLHPVTSHAVFKTELKHGFLKETLPVTSDPG